MKRPVILFVLMAFAVQLAGCGGGGGGGGGSASPTVYIPITGVAKKGPIRNAIVSAYTMTSTGNAGTFLASAPSDDNGKFSLSVPQGTGPVIIEVRGNSQGTSSYVNEANPSGPPITFTSNDALHAVLDVRSTAIANTAITPFTDMVADYMRTFFSLPVPPKDLPTAIVAATNAVTTIARALGVQDITNPDDQGYASFLALFTQYMLDKALGLQPNVQDATEMFILAAMNDRATLDADLTKAYNTLIANGITVTRPQPIPALAPPDFSGSTSLPATVTLRTEGVLPSGSLVGSIDVTLTLPLGVSLKSSPSSVNPAVLVPDAGVVVPKGDAARSDCQILATYVKGSPNKLVIKLISANGMAIGDYAVVNVDVASGFSTLATDFTIASNSAQATGVSDLNTAPLSQVEVKYTAVGGGFATPKPGTPLAVTLDAVGILPSGALIGAIDVIMNLPAGVTVKATPSSINPAVLVPDAGVVTLTGPAATASTQVQATYTRGTPNRLTIRLVSPTGFTTGSFATINCVLDAGATKPTSANFSITPSTGSTTGVFDLNTTAVPGVSISVK